MAYNYPYSNNRHYQQIPDQYNLKPVGSAETTSLAGYSDGSYRPVSQPNTYYSGGAELERLGTKDEKLKYRVRVLRLVSRILSVIISGATVAPLAMTLIKFFQTRNQMLTVDGEQRTAWASGTIAWYTYLYFGVSTTSFILYSAVLIGYCFGGVKKANKASMFSGIWSGVLMVVHIVIWAISIAIYRYGKIPKDGRSTDLWGWTCSTAADEIQSQITNIDYSKYCTAQTSSFYTGIAEVFTSVLTASIYFFAFKRMRSKKQVIKAEVRASQSSMEPLRS